MSTSITDGKRELRKLVRAVKPKLAPADYLAKGHELADALMELPMVRDAAAVVAFWPMRDEVNTGPFIMRVRRMGKRVFLPVMVGDDLVFREFDTYQCLAREPRFGIMEPQGTATMDVSDAGRGLVIVAPGMAFTSSGDRLGRGRGFYDRAFAQLPEAHRVGVCYRIQMVREIPTEPHDVTMHRVVAV